MRARLRKRFGQAAKLSPPCMTNEGGPFLEKSEEAPRFEWIAYLGQEPKDSATAK